MGLCADSRKFVARRLLNHYDCNIVTCFMHPFAQWGLRRVTGLVPAKNTDALRFDLHLGFKQEGYLRHALPDDDLVLLGMLRENCRFIPERYRV